MNIIRNDKVIRRNALIAKTTMFGSLFILAGGMFFSFKYPEQFGLSLAALMFGFILSQVGIYFTNRWGRSPRPDELLDQALKGLDNKYTIYHFSSPTPHLLVGPAGVWALIPYHQRGTISFSKGRWRQKGGNFYLKIFAQEGLGRPDLELGGEIEKLNKYLGKHLPLEDTPPIQAALVFTNPDTEIAVTEDDNPPAATTPLKKLKPVIRKAAKGKSLSTEKVNLVNEALAN